MLAVGIAGALAAYFAIALYAAPALLLENLQIPRPAPVVSGVILSASQVALGDPVTVSVTATNTGDSADMQIVSVGFPNVTRGSEIGIIRHDFRQTPVGVEVGREVGSGYTGESSVPALYPSVEPFSRPWEKGSTYSIDLQVSPQSEGRFVIFVKSVAFPHSWDGAHFPQEGLSDYQGEFVDEYSITVTKS